MCADVIWFDASTPKRALLSAVLSRLLRGEGYETIITVRSYDYSIKVLEDLGEPYVAVGVHGGGSLRGKLIADIGRMVDLEVVVEEFSPKVLISYPSPPAARVAFGLGIPYIALGDTPHGIAMNRLSYPLASVVIVSEFIVDEIERFVLKDFTAMETFRGVDEVLWVREYKPNPANIEKLGLKPFTYMIFRPEEFKAHYYSNIESSLVLKLAEKASSLGYTPVIIPRYREHAIQASKVENAVVLDKPFYGPDIEYHSAAVVTGGITMAREAALMGTPGITLFDRVISIDTALSKIGFPIYYASSYEEAEKLLTSIARDPQKHRVNTKKLLENLESPWPLIIKWVRKLVR